MKNKYSIKTESKVSLEKSDLEHKDLTKKEEGEKIDSLVLKIEPESTKTWFKQKLLEWLETVRDHPIMIAQRKAIAMFKDRKFKLRKGVQYGNLDWKRGDIGWTLDALSLGLLPESARQILEDQLKKPDLSLCSLGEYIYVLPNDYLRFIGNSEKDSDQPDLL